MITEKCFFKTEPRGAADKRLGYRREIANAEINGEYVRGMVFFFSTPIGMMICAEIKCDGRYEGNILKLAFSFEDQEHIKNKMNKNFPLMYVKNGRAWLRYITAKLNYHDIIGEEIGVFTVTSDVECECIKNTAKGRISPTKINKSAMYDLNHA